MELPEGAVLMYGIHIVVYLDKDGTVFDDFDTEGDATLRDYLGTLEAVKFRMCCDQFNVESAEE